MLTESYQIRHFTGHKFQASDKTSLSLVISPQAMMYSVSLSGFSEVFELGHMEFNLNSAMSEEERLEFFIRNFLLHQRVFEKVLVSVLSTEFALLPLAFGNENDVKEYLQFSSGETNGKLVFSHKVGDLRFGYALSAELCRVLEKNFNAVFIRHAGAVNLSLFFNHRSFTNTQVGLFLGEHVMELALKKNEKLVYYNVLKWSTHEDVLYYLLFALEQFGFDPAQSSLALIGEIPMDAEFVKTLKKYIKTTVGAVTGEPVKLHKELAQLPGHYYFTLFNQHTCEL
jgi:hypothetical protein